MLPSVDFCGLDITRLIIGANPFGGFSHQGKQRNEEMKAYHTVERIIETWHRAEAAGINTMITNNTSPNVFAAVKEYLAAKGALQWIGQLNTKNKPDMFGIIDNAVEIGCKALFFHGTFLDDAYAQQDATELQSWVEHARKHGVPVGAASHLPEAHLWINDMDILDFHMVCFSRCGSLHKGAGEKFSLNDIAPAVAAIQAIAKPCIGYKIMQAGRIDPRMAFDYAFEHIKPNDVVNVGMHRGDKDDMVEENANIVRELLQASAAPEKATLIPAPSASGG